MADFMTVLAATQMQTGNGPQGGLSAALPTGSQFDVVLSTQIAAVAQALAPATSVPSAQVWSGAFTPQAGQDAAWNPSQAAAFPMAATARTREPLAVSLTGGVDAAAGAAATPQPPPPWPQSAAAGETTAAIQVPPGAVTPRTAPPRASVVAISAPPDLGVADATAGHLPQTAQTVSAGTGSAANARYAMAGGQLEAMFPTTPPVSPNTVPSNRPRTVPAQTPGNGQTAAPVSAPVSVTVPPQAALASLPAAPAASTDAGLNLNQAVETVSRRLDEAQRAQQPASMLGTLRFAQATAG